MAINGNGTPGPLMRVNGSQSIVAAGLRLLLRAHEYASHSSTDIWQFALEAEELRQVGLTNSEFRWLLVKGYVKQAQEITLPGDDSRSFRLLGRFTMSANSCFVLTEVGVRVASELSFHQPRSAALAFSDAATERISSPPINGAAENGRSHLLKPTWDSERKELRLGGSVVKVYKWPASNQEVILEVFEEEGWPARIEDPLPYSVEQDAKRRLHDTIKCLNRSQKSPLVHFRGDGTGEGVIWEFTSDVRTKPLLRSSGGVHQLVASID